MPFVFRNYLGNLYVAEESILVGPQTFTFTAASLNITSWFNPSNATLVNTNQVTAITDTLGVNNLTTITAAGTVLYSTYNGYPVLYQPSTSVKAQMQGPAVSNIYGGVIFGYSIPLTPPTKLFTVFNNNGTGSSLFVRYLAGNPYTLYGPLGESDLGYAGNVFLNGTSISSGANNSILTGLPDLPTKWNIMYSKFGTSYQTIDRINLFSQSFTNTDQQFNGYLSDMFVVNTSFTTANQQVIEGYLAYKLGMQGRLPPTHPYYSPSNNIKIIINP